MSTCPGSVCAAPATRRINSGACSCRMSDAGYRSASAWHGTSSILSGSVGQIFAGAAWIQPYSAGSCIRTLSRYWSDSQTSMDFNSRIPTLVGGNWKAQRGEGVRVWEAKMRLSPDADKRTWHGLSVRHAPYAVEKFTPSSIPASRHTFCSPFAIDIQTNDAMEAFDGCHSLAVEVDDTR
jgi:hypothetical protein